MYRIQVEHRPDGTTRFLALSGIMGGRWFSLHDVDRSSGNLRRLALGSPLATRRVFLEADRGRWFYEFAPGDTRALNVASLERHLGAKPVRR